MRTNKSRMVLLTAAVLSSTMVLGCFDIFGTGGDDEGDGGTESSKCPGQEALLAGKWITPEGATTSSSSYNTVTYTLHGSVSVYQFAGGYDNSVSYAAWMIASTPGGSCDKIRVKYNGSWLSDYSKIHVLSACKLEIEATDGTYYGTKTKYDRVGAGCGGSGGGTDAGPDQSATCQKPCDPSSDACESGEACLRTVDGYECVPSECQGCWDDGVLCSSNSSTCEFYECTSEGIVDPSATCEDPCDPGGIDCEEGEACLNSAQGYICVPPECQSCWNQGLSCSWASSSCAFTECTPG